MSTDRLKTNYSVDYYYYYYNIMSSPVKEQAVIDIRATMESHSDIEDDLLAISRLSGADAVASFHGIAKATVVKVAKMGCFTLFCIDDVLAENNSVEAQTTKFKIMCCMWQGSSVMLLHDRNAGSKCGAQKQGTVVHHQ